MCIVLNFIFCFRKKVEKIKILLPFQSKNTKDEGLTEHLGAHLVLKPRGGCGLVGYGVDTVASANQVGQIRCGSRCAPLNSHRTQGEFGLQRGHGSHWTDIPRGGTGEVGENFFGGGGWLGEISLNGVKGEIEGLSWDIVLEEGVDGIENVASSLTIMEVGEEELRVDTSGNQSEVGGQVTECKWSDKVVNGGLHSGEVGGGGFVGHVNDEVDIVGESGKGAGHRGRLGWDGSWWWGWSGELDSWARQSGNPGGHIGQLIWCGCEEGVHGGGSNLWKLRVQVSHCLLPKSN